MKDMIKVVSKEVNYWTEVKENSVKDIANLEKLLKFNKAIVEMATKKIKEEE